ncbi:MAG: D-alanine--D-alanine ligase [Rhodospirillales bacterium]|nr:D-alanine--D-alanine ligase [Rhodospirillales bacterium]
MKKNIVLLVGGWSAERDVSLMKGKAVEAALREGGYAVRTVDVTRDLSALLAALTPRPDAVFNNLHGQGGEDGTIQAVLEALRISYTHSGVLASAIGMHKPTARRLADSVGVQSPPGCVVRPSDIAKESHGLPRPYVIKPAAEGSSVGVRIVREGDSLPRFDPEHWAFGDDILVESFIPGRELTVAVLGGKAQGVTEIISATDFFDYDAKYKDTKTRYVLPAEIPESVYGAAMDAAERVYAVVGCAGIARCDFRYDDSRNGPDGLYFLEINTQPGFTPESIGPSQVIRNGMSFVQLCAHLVETARCHGTAHENQTSGDDAHAATTAEQAA